MSTSQKQKYLISYFAGFAVHVLLERGIAVNVYNVSSTHVWVLGSITWSIYIYFFNYWENISGV